MTVEGVKHDLVTHFELVVLGLVFVGMMCLVDLRLHEVVMGLCHVVGQSFDHLGCGPKSPGSHQQVEAGTNGGKILVSDPSEVGILKIQWRH